MVKRAISIAILVVCGGWLLVSYGPSLMRGPGGRAQTKGAKPDATTPSSPETPLSADGQSGKKTQVSALEGRILRKGMEGPDVSWLQERLRLAGFVHKKFSPGIFDDATEEALLEYQKGNAFLAEMYGFHGLPPPHKPYMDEALAKQLQRVPTPDKVLIRHTVARKENLFQIATRYGIGPNSIRYLNGLSNPDALKVGQSLFIICDQSKVGAAPAERRGE